MLPPFVDLTAYPTEFRWLSTGRKIDWTLSDAGQSLLATFGYVVARKGVKQSFPALLEKESILADPEFIGPILEETGGDFRNVFMGGH